MMSNTGWGAPDIVAMRVSSQAARDARAYNTPVVGEVAAIFVGNDGAPPCNRDMVVYPRDGEPHRVSELHEFVDPLSYPLLFHRDMPRGRSTDLLHAPECQSRKKKRTRLTIMQFYAHQLMRREGGSILPHAAGRLFQQYCVDAYTKM